jgi:hypothetical protein
MKNRSKKDECVSLPQYVSAMVEERHGGRSDLGEVQRSLLHLKLNLNDMSETENFSKEGM